MKKVWKWDHIYPSIITLEIPNQPNLETLIKSKKKVQLNKYKYKNNKSKRPIRQQIPNFLFLTHHNLSSNKQTHHQTEQQ